MWFITVHVCITSSTACIWLHCFPQHPETGLSPAALQAAEDEAEDDNDGSASAAASAMAMADAADGALGDGGFGLDRYWPAFFNISLVALYIAWGSSAPMTEAAGV